MTHTPPNIKFALQKFQTEQFAIIEQNFSAAEKVQFSFSFDFQIIHSQRIIIVSLEFSFMQHNNPFLVGKVAGYFKVGSEEWLNFCTEKQITVPKSFIAHLAMITVGTTRGILHTKTEGTAFNRFLFPLINVSNSIKGDICFNL
jgi:hypothetical protein